ncbi:MAG TPA: Maf family protein [Bryobacteraceae bacterium]|nr:Maf family protein [Bryobacteraceae bacterium]
MLVLASNSPRRREILRAAGIDFVVRVPNIHEERRREEPPEEYVRRLAEQKAFAVPMNAGETVLAADTTVVVDDQLLEKPRDAADAARMLALLSGRVHEVMTGICLRTADRLVVDVAATRVRFTELTDAEIAEYVASGEPMDKAGAYAIQGLASKFIERVEGCYFNVVGLPIALVYRHLKSLNQTS